MIISHLGRYCFVKTRKTAGTSIEMALAEHLGPEGIVRRKKFAAGVGVATLRKHNAVLKLSPQAHRFHKREGHVEKQPTCKSAN